MENKLKCLTCGQDLPEKVENNKSQNAEEVNKQDKKKFLEWNENYSVGNIDIDEQHKILFTLINDVHNAVNKTGVTGNYIEYVILRLEEYVKYHFSFEEQLLIAGGYPKFKEHKELHTKFMKSVEEYKSKYKSNIVPIREILDFMLTWTRDHVMKEDQDFKAYINYFDK